MGKKNFWKNYIRSENRVYCWMTLWCASWFVEVLSCRDNSEIDFYLVEGAQCSLFHSFLWENKQFKCWLSENCQKWRKQWPYFVASRSVWCNKSLKHSTKIKTAVSFRLTKVKPDQQEVFIKSRICLNNKNHSQYFHFTVCWNWNVTHIVLSSKKIQKRDNIGIILVGIYW